MKMQKVFEVLIIWIVKVRMLEKGIQKTKTQKTKT